MNVLEKILGEIEKRVNYRKSLVRYEKKNGTITDVARNQGALEEIVIVAKIIDSNMNDAKDINVPSNDGWIPVEDGLPEEGEEVEVTIEEMADSAGGMRYYTKTAWVQEERWVIKRNPCNPRVIAWRPLPEPYKPNKDNSATEHIMSRFMTVE